LLADSRNFLIDFNESCQLALYARQSHTPLLLRFQELLLDPTSPVTFKSEIWSLACELFFVIGSRPLFRYWFPSDDVFVDKYTNVLDRLPEEMWARWTNPKNFSDDQLRRVNEEQRQLLEERLEYSIRGSRGELKTAEMSEEEKCDFLVMMRSMLESRPVSRPSAQDVLESGWVQKWVYSILESIGRKLN
jgi:serine/threonine-protein kinase SRPK3